MRHWSRCPDGAPPVRINLSPNALSEHLLGGLKGLLREHPGESQVFLHLGERQIVLDCDVLQADGGTRTAAITGSWVALFDCLKWMEQRAMFKTWPLKDHVAAISCGIHGGTPVLDLDYPEDSSAGTDANFVMTGSGGIVEIQGTAEGEAQLGRGERAGVDDDVGRRETPGAQSFRICRGCLDGAQPAQEPFGIIVSHLRVPPLFRLELAVSQHQCLRKGQRGVAEIHPVQERAIRRVIQPDDQ